MNPADPDLDLDAWIDEGQAAERFEGAAELELRHGGDE